MQNKHRDGSAAKSCGLLMYLAAEDGHNQGNYFNLLVY